MAADKVSFKEHYVLMFGHMADDLSQGALPAILTMLYLKGSLESFTQIATLILATTIVNALAQPLTGYFADKKSRPYIMTLGMLTAAFGVMFLCFIHNFYLMIISVALSGIGIALFHPSAGKIANALALKKVGRAMSIFSVGGNIGFALGPLYFAFFYQFFDIYATLTLILPAFIMALVFCFKNNHYVKSLERLTHKLKSIDTDAKDNIKGMSILLLLVFARSAAMFSLTAFLPLYFIKVLNVQESVSTLSITVFALSGAIATLLGGTLSDKFGFTKLVQVSSLLTLPCILLFVISHNLYLSLVSLIPLAVFYYAGMSPIVVIGQKLLPHHVGMATGITIGLGVSFGGIVAPLIAKIGDNYGIYYVMLTIAIILLVAFLISLFVPKIQGSKNIKEQKA